MKKKFIATIEVNALVDVPVMAGTLEEAVQAARDLVPSDALKVKSKRIGLIDWETRSVTSVYEE